MTSSDREYDFLGIGFGPSNLALAIAMDERNAAQASGSPRPSYAFIEKQADFVWHGGMLLGDTDMQISFLKDLATLRNPGSRYTFINYLHSKGRLEAFINLKTFFPSRVEFNDYLAWVAAHFADRCHYGEEVLDVTPDMRDGVVQRLRVRSRDADGQVQQRLCRNLVIGVGGAPCVPAAFRGWEDERVLHSSAYLQRIHALMDDGKKQRVAVVGSGQSAAEVFVDIARRFPQAEISMVMRSCALKPSDDSPFVNEIFSPGFTDVIYRQPEERRQQMLREFRNTNYAVVDLDLIESIYQMLYLQRVSGEQRHRLLPGRQIECAVPDRDGVELVLRDLASGTLERPSHDVVVLATGYRHDTHKQLLQPLAAHVEDDFAVSRNYRLKTSASCLPQIYLQGCCEESHGLSDTLLSVLSVRSQEIVEAMFAQQEDAPGKARLTDALNASPA
jgi:L-ornithine N5-oxygenase